VHCHRNFGYTHPFSSTPPRSSSEATARMTSEDTIMTGAVGGIAKFANERTAGIGETDYVNVGPFASGSIPARTSAQTFTAAERAAGNKIGNKTGCHTCGTTNPGTKSGNWVLDHQPPTALNPTRRPQSLYPQCVDCSRAQGRAIAQMLRGNGGTGW